MHDAAVGRHHAEIAERALAPGEESEALAVARELDFGVASRRVGGPSHVGDQRMVDDEIDGNFRIDGHRVAAGRGHRLAQRGKIHHHRHAEQILQQHARRPERNLEAALAARQCREHPRLDVRRTRMAQQVLREDTQRKRQLREPGKAGIARHRRRQTVITA